MAVTLVGPASGAQSPPAGKSGFRRPLPVPANTQAPQVPAPVPMAPPSASTTPLTTPPSPSGRVRLIGPASQNPTATPIAVPPAPPVPPSGVTLVGPAPQPKRTGMFAIGTSAPAPPPKPETISLGEGLPEIEVGDIPMLEAEGDNATRLMLRVAKFRKEPEKNGLETKEGWANYVGRNLPFIVPDVIDEGLAVKDAWLNIDSNERMPEESLDNLARVIVNTELRDQEESQKGIIHKGLDLAASIPAIGIEVGATMGTVGALGVPAAAKYSARYGLKTGVRFLMPKVARKAINAATARLSRLAAVKAAERGGELAVTSAIAAHLNPFRLAKGVTERMLPSMESDKLVKGENLGDAYFNAATMGTIENMTEALGGGIIGDVLKKAGGTKTAGKAVEMLAKMPGAKVAKAVKESTAKWLAGKAGLQLPEAVKVLADKAKFHSLFGEMMEERYGEGMRAISDQVLGTNIGDENMGVTGNLGLAAYKKLKGEHGAAADHFIGALGQLAVEGFGMGVARGGMRAAGVAYKAGGLDYDHSQTYASLWSTANPEAADQLLKRNPDKLSRAFFASIGLPATIGLPKRKEFAAMVFAEKYGQQGQAAPAANQQGAAPAGPQASTTQAPPRTPNEDTIVTDKDGKSYVEYMNDEGDLIRTPLPEATLDVTPPAAPPVATAEPTATTTPPVAAPTAAARDELDPSDEEFAAAKDERLTRIKKRIEEKRAIGDVQTVLTLMDTRDRTARGERDDEIKGYIRRDKIKARAARLVYDTMPPDGEHPDVKAELDKIISEVPEETDLRELSSIGKVDDVLEILSEPITLEQVNNKLDALARSNGHPNAKPGTIAAARRQRWRIENPSYKATAATKATPATQAPAPTPAKTQQAPPAGTKGKEKSFNTFRDIKDAIAQGTVEEGDSGTTLKEGVKWRVAKGANGTLYAHSVKDEPPAAEKKKGKQGEIDKFVRAVPEEAGHPPEEIDAMTPKDAEALATSIENDYLASNSASSGRGPEGGKLSTSTIKKLDSEPTVTRYRSMMLIDGKLYPPMSTSLDGALRAPEPIGEWMQSEERPDLIAKSGSNAGKFPLRNMTGATWVVYAPYFHSSANPLNAQFEAAWRKPLVTVEIEIPAKDDYQAKESPRAVGPHPWGRGRIVDLSRYAKIKRIVPDSEVARLIADSIPEGTKVRDNVVTASLRKELEKAGVEIEVTGIVPDSNAAGPAESFAGDGEPAAEGKPKKERVKSWKPGATHKEKRKHLRSMSENAIDEEVDAIGPGSGGEVREIYKAMSYIDHHLETLCRMGENAEGGYEEGFAAVSKLIGENMAKMWALLNSAFSAQNAVPKHTVAGLDLAIRFDTFYHKNQRNPTEEEATAMFWATSEATRSGGPAQTTVHLPKAVRVMMAGYANNAVGASYTDLWNVSSSVVDHAVGKVPGFGLSSQGNPRLVVLDTYMARLLTAKLIGHKYNPGMQVAVKNDKGEITGYKTLSRAQQLKEAQKKWISHDNNYIAYSARVRKVARKLSKQAQDKWEADKAAGKEVGERPRDMPAGVAQERIWAATYAIIGLKNAGRSDDEALDTIEHKDVRAAWDLMSLILENDDVKAVLKRHGVKESYLESLATEAKAITEKYRPTGLSGFAGAGVSSRFRNFARLIRPTGPTEGAEVAKLHGRQSIDVVLSASTPHIEGLKALTDAARSGNDKEAIETLNGIARDSLEHLFGGIDGVDVSYDSNFGVYMGEGEPSLGVSVTFNEREKGAVLAALARFADNFDQQEVHVRKDTKDPVGKNYDDGSYSTPVFHVSLDPKQGLTIEEIKKIMETSGLKGLTVNKNYLEAYYVGNTQDTAAVTKWREQVNAVVQSLTGRSRGVEQTVSRLWIYGDTTGSIPYRSIQGVVRPAPTREIKSAARVARRHMKRKVKGTEQASEITREQDALQTGIGDHYGAMPDNDLDRAIVREAYEEAAKELKEQFLELPIKVEAWMEMKDGKLQPREGRPYQTSGDMRAGIMGNNRMFFDATIPSQFGPKDVTYDNHPLLEDSGLTDVNGYPLLYNDLLRVVHDYYAHGLTKTEFGPRGEEAAWRNHMAATKSPLAKWAITMETRGQNSWVNFRSDLDKSIPPKDRPFARQKVGLLPIKYSLTGDPEIDRGMKKFIASLSERDREGTLPENEAGTLKSSNAATPGFKKKFSDAFRKWFGKSKVVDEEGNPLILSHATKDDIDVFESTGWGGTVGWFGSRKVTSEFAKSRFGWWKDMGRDWDNLRHTASGKMMEGVRIMPVYLSIKNPFDARFIPNVSLTSFSKEEFDEAADMIAKELGVSRDELVESIPKTKHYAAVNKTYSYTPHIADLLGNTVAVDAMKDKGHDGFVTREFDEDVWVPFDSTQVKSQLSNNGNYDPSKPSINEAAAFHGTPHKVERFTTAKVGTGEGAQSYGWGLYFATKQAIARFYRDKLSNPAKAMQRRIQDLYDQDTSREDAIDAVLADSHFTSAEKGLLEALNDEDWLGFDWPHQAVKAAMGSDVSSSFDVSQELLDAIAKAKAAKGNLYEVNLKPTEDEYLLLDSKIRNQSEKVKASLASLVDKVPGLAELLSGKQVKPSSWERLAKAMYVQNRTASLSQDGLPDDGLDRVDFGEDESLMDEYIGHQDEYGYTPSSALRGYKASDREKIVAAFNKVSPGLGDGINGKMTGKDLIDQLERDLDKKETSMLLLSTGIRGNKYFDASSRSDGEKTYNYVIFDDSDVEIVATHQAAKPGSRKASTGGTNSGQSGLGNRPNPGNPGGQPETSRGKKLFQDQQKADTSVGTRTISEFLASGMHALMILTKSQLTKSSPGKYISGFRNRLGQLVSSPYHVAFIRTNDGNVDWHEIGHAMSSMFESINPNAYAKWVAFWQDQLKELSRKGYSSVNDSVEEGVAEMFRLYMNKSDELESMKVSLQGGKQKSLLDGMNELLSGIGAEETAVIRDAKRLWDAHRAKPLSAQGIIFSRDKGYTPPKGMKDAVQLGRDAMAAYFSKTVRVQSLLKDAMTQLSALEQSGIGNVSAIFKLLPGVSLAFGISEGKRKSLKTSVLKARSALKQLRDNGADIETAFNNIARLNLESERILHGTNLEQGGLRVFSGMKKDDLTILSHDLMDVDLPGFTEAGTGEYTYVASDKGMIKLYAEIKEAIGEGNWEAFENYGQWKTVLARHRYRQEIRDNWNTATQGPKPKPYEYPEMGNNSIQEIEAMVDQYEKDNPKFVDSYLDVQTLMDGYLSISVLSGEFSVEEAGKIKKAYEFYWPLGRLQRGDQGFEGAMKKLEISYGVESARDGSGLPFRRLDDIMQSRTSKVLMAYNYGRMLDTATMFSRQMAYLTPDFRDKVKWMQMFVPLNVDLDVAKVRPEEHRQIIANYLNDMEAKKNGYSSKEDWEAAEPGSLLKADDIDLRGPGEVVLWRETAPRMAQVIARKVNGKMKYTYVSDPGMLDILTSGGTLAQTAPKMAAILGVLGATSKPLSRVITRSLPFSIFNTFYRDPKTAMMTGEGKGAVIPLYYSYTALKAVVHGWTGKQTQFEKEAMSEIFAMYGQATSPLNAFGKSFMGALAEGITRDADGKKINYSPSQVGWPKVAQSVAGAAASVILKPVDLANWVSGGWWLSPKGEALTRMGAYIDARNRGLTQEQSVMAADNSTANFNQRSTNQAFLMADKQAMFFNANAQVKWQFYRQLFHPDPSVRGSAYVKMLYSGALHAMILPAVILAMKAVGDDEIDKWLEAWLKQEDERSDSDKARLGSIPLLNGLHLKVPFDNGPASMFDSMAFNTSLAWLAGAKSRGETIDQAAAAMYTRLMSFTGPGLSQLINPLIRTVIESNINFEFYNNRRIVPDGISSIYEKKQQTTPSTPETWNQAAEWLDTYGIEASPLKIRHIVNNIGLRYVDQIAAWYDEKTPKENSNRPLVGQLFTKSPRGFSSQPVISLSEMESKFDSAKKELEKAISGEDRKRAEEASKMMVSLQGYKAWHGIVMRQWQRAKKLRDAGRIDEAVAQEHLMTETARRGLKQAALQEAEALEKQGN